MTDWLALLERHTGDFAGLLADADLEAPVSACPGWTLRDLAQHLGWVHGWATHAVVAGDAEGDPPAGPDERRALQEWYAASAGALLAALRERGDGPAWTFGPPRGSAAFWHRRQVHETRMHLWDARDSQGVADRLDPALAWDGVREVAEVFYPRQVRKGRVEPLTRTLRLRATDVGEQLDLGEGDVHTLEAPAHDLLLVLWHRTPAPADAAHLVSRPLTP